MAFLDENPVWEDGIHFIETTDKAKGGINGVANKPTLELANRTLYLRQKLDSLGLRGQANGVASLDSDAKIPLSQLPDAIVGQMIYGGTIEAGLITAVIATLSTNAKSLLDVPDNTVTLSTGMGNGSTTFGASQLQGCYFIAANPSPFASLSIETGDWLISTADGWKKIDNQNNNILMATSSGGLIQRVLTIANTTDADSTSTGALIVAGGIGAGGNIFGSRVYNAVWNDIADFITLENDIPKEYGKVYCKYNNKFFISNKRGCKGVIGIASDTYGFGVGQKNIDNEIPIAIGGFVLAYTDKVYDEGIELISTKNGCLTRANVWERLFNRQAIVGKFYAQETNTEWNGIKVNGRNWIKVY